MGLAYLRSDVEGPTFLLSQLRSWKKGRKSRSSVRVGWPAAFETGKTVIMGSPLNLTGSLIAMAKSISKDWKPAVLYQQDRN